MASDPSEEITRSHSSHDATWSDVAGLDFTSFDGVSPLGSLPNQRIDRFQTIREIGRGGFGIVYLAKDLALESASIRVSTSTSCRF
jgi:serine/threonine protein kinase